MVTGEDVSDCAAVAVDRTLVGGCRVVPIRGRVIGQLLVDVIRPGVSGGFVSRKDEPRGSRIEAVL
ncbi:hypothetical protein KUG88_28985, partial [Rhodococcus rhodochrous]|uniref:hypothetical protein n=1 Tax=Rhodococcus rhodochrous TaxID=1829 RepID=UPI001E3C42B7